MRVLLVLVMLLSASPLAARLVAIDRHAELQRAARVAMTCPDIAPGRYVVGLRLTAEPPHAEAHLTEAPLIRLATQRCIERAFVVQRYAYVRGMETHEHPFVLLDVGP